MVSSSLDLSRVDDLAAYLEATPDFACQQLTPLTGGTGNYTFRLHLKRPYKGRSTLVVKHAKPYVPGNRNIAFALDRQVRPLDVSSSLIVNRKNLDVRGKSTIACGEVSPPRLAHLCSRSSLA